MISGDHHGPFQAALGFREVYVHCPGCVGLDNFRPPVPPTYPEGQQAGEYTRKLPDLAPQVIILNRSLAITHMPVRLVGDLQLISIRNFLKHVWG